MTVEYGVVIRRQLPHGEVKWQLWLGSGMVKEHASFLVVMNHAGAMGFEAVAAGHFDELGVPEVLLQRKMETFAFMAKPPQVDLAAEPPKAAKPPQIDLAAQMPRAAAGPGASSEKSKTPAKSPGRRKPAPSSRG
jgi:hypothetical protein